MYMFILIILKKVKEKIVNMEFMIIGILIN